MPPSPKVIYAQAILSDDANSERSRAAAIKRLEEEEFIIHDRNSSSSTITISATSDVYARVFKSRTAADGSYADMSSAGFGGSLQKVVIENPKRLLGNGQAFAQDPAHLDVPGDTSALCNAELVHRNWYGGTAGITGRGVRVAMVDTGCAANHPYFLQHGYRINPVAGPGVGDPADTNGHGTASAAVLLSIAPDAELIMVTALVSRRRLEAPIAAFKAAVDQRPDIICCGWEAAQSGNQSSAADDVLGAEINRAIDENIIVVFAAQAGSTTTLVTNNVALIQAPNNKLTDLLPDGQPTRLRVPGPGSWQSLPPSASLAAAGVAGICALIRQADPRMEPARVSQILDISRDSDRPRSPNGARVIDAFGATALAVSDMVARSRRSFLPKAGEQRRLSDDHGATGPDGSGDGSGDGSHEGLRQLWEQMLRADDGG
jgi:subtilisin family serine protease